jgi:hypothetical protein
MNNQDVENQIIRALGMPSRGMKARALERAFLMNILVTNRIRKTLSEADSLTLDFLMSDSPVNQANDATPHCAMWVEENYPALAEAFTHGAAILEIIEIKKYWRELGFSSWEEFDGVIENEAWLESKVKSLQAGNN